MWSSNRTGLMLLVAAAFAAVLTVSATQVMHRPVNYKDSPRNFTQGKAEPHIIHKRATGKANMAYFTNWYVAQCARFSYAHMGCRGIYGANFRRLRIISALLGGSTATRIQSLPTLFPPT